MSRFVSRTDWGAHNQGLLTTFGIWRNWWEYWKEVKERARYVSR